MLLNKTKKIIGVVFGEERPARVPGLEEKELHGLGCRPIDRDECFSYQCARWIGESPVGPGCAEKVSALLLAEIYKILIEKGGDLNGSNRTAQGAFEAGQSGRVGRGGGDYSGCEPPVSSGHQGGILGERFPGDDADKQVSDATGDNGSVGGARGEQNRPEIDGRLFRIGDILKNNIDYTIRDVAVKVIAPALDNLHIALQDIVELMKQSLPPRHKGSKRKKSTSVPK